LLQSVLLITSLDEIIHCEFVLKTDQKALKIMILYLSINFHWRPTSLTISSLL